jgi:hypothetical protein
MNNSTGQLNSLYYPFSRLLDDSTLKYLLLVFDSVTFIDEAENAEWRKVLLQKMAHIDSPIFSSYEKLADDYDMLSDTGAIQIINPNQLQARHSQGVALATKADLSDQKFLEIASKPSSFGLTARPFGKYGGLPADKPTWQVFKGKIASPLFLDNTFINDKTWASHILVPGDDNYSWTLSYEAGSAAVTNFYLEAAQELQLTPVTTSDLHHALVLRKLKRIFSDGDDKINLIDDIQRKRFRAVFGQGEIIRLLGALYPAAGLSRVSFSEIVKFRKETKELRHIFIQEVDELLRVVDSDPTSITYDKDVIEAVKSLKSDFIKLENDLVSARDKILPSFTEAMLYGTAGGGALSAFISFLGGFSPSSVVAASALTVSGAFLVKAIELWNEKRKLIRNQSSSISYLTKVSQFINK